MKRFVSNQKGIFLVEQLLALILTTILSAAATVLISSLAAYQINPNHLSQHEIETLATRMQQESAYAGQLLADGGQLRMVTDGQTVSYTFQNQRISRLVNGRGGEIALYNVKDFQTYQLPNAALLKITNHAGQIHEIFLTRFLPEDRYE